MERTGMDIESMAGCPELTRFEPGPAWRARHRTPTQDADALGRQLVEDFASMDKIDAYLAAVRHNAVIAMHRDRARDARRAGL